MSKQVDSWHQVGAGGSDFVAELSAAQEFALLVGEGCLLAQDPALVWELAECGRVDFLAEGE